ncbi:MAG: SDR family NAD(P)-dependent oxidoreductase, partial [Nocardioidaceae bacterium]
TMWNFPHVCGVDAGGLVATCLRHGPRGRVVSIPTRRYRALTVLARHAPRFLVRRASGAVSRARHH